MFSDWLARQKCDSLCVVSPHLDDAVLSASAALMLPGLVNKKVVTVVTAGERGVSTDWSRLTGFVDCDAEHNERRREDIEVLGRLGTEVEHLGAVSGNPRSIRNALATLLPRIQSLPSNWAVVVPAGAGRRPSIAERVARRILRRPLATGPHPEHISVRDACAPLFVRSGHRAGGFFAEYPYVQHETLATVQTRLEVTVGGSLQRHCLVADPGVKRDLIAGYQSQAKIFLDPDPEAQRQMLVVPEYLFLTPYRE